MAELRVLPAKNALFSLNMFYVCLAPVLVKLSFKCKYDGKQEGVFRTEIR
jgi:hypothetical protein